MLAAGSVAWAGLDIQRWTTPQGARVYFVENHDLPMLDLSVAFAAGSAYDTAAKSGLANLTRHMMNLGAGELDERRIAEKLADVGAEMSGFFDQDRAGFSLRTLSGQAERDAALAVLRSVLARPTFPAAVLEREKTRAIANLQEAATKPEFLADKAFQAAIYGSHPYALPETGEPETIAKLGRADLAGFHQSHYRAANMTVAIMGDLDRAGAEKLAADLAADLPAGAAPAALAPVPALAIGSEEVIPHHATQSHILVGQPGMTRADPDYFPLLVGNYVLGGGGFDSRLVEEIRQKRGLAYSAYSYFMPLKELGAFQIGLQTRRDATDQALAVVRDTLRGYLADGPTEAELKQARDNLVGSFPLRLDSNRKILEYLAMMGFYNLPADWLDTYPKKVAAVTRDDVIRALRARLHPDAMATVIVGGQVEPEKAKN
ncbi:MAG: insulinase family protein [Thiobacillus sp.]|nr:insulinase family protein [Thiobacillus sp.]